ncbi:hypothetical protein ACFQ46_18560 [Kineococcus sp. GCM10028916]|uniref:hypothetical protein n=1 Tax=Kineococcus sp. GCM10028916 TaxID=3273394 RepID=UPI00362A5402
MEAWRQGRRLPTLSAMPNQVADANGNGGDSSHHHDQTEDEVHSTGRGQASQALNDDQQGQKAEEPGTPAVARPGSAIIAFDHHVRMTRGPRPSFGIGQIFRGSPDE